MTLELFSRWSEVDVTLNGRRIGKYPTGGQHQFRAQLSLPYAPGQLVIRGLEGGQVREELVLQTAGAVSEIRLSPDHSEIRPSRHALVFVEVSLCDDQGIVCAANQSEVNYEVRGPATIAGIGSGDLTDTASYRANPRRVHHGRAIVIIRSTGEAGEIRLTAQSGALQAQATIEARKPGPRPLRYRNRQRPSTPRQP